MTTTKMKTADELLGVLHKAKTQRARTLLYHVLDATRAYESTRGALAEAIEFARRELERAVGRMNDGDIPNSLGILQNNGVTIDRLCGETNQTLEAARAAQKLLADLGIE